jgi:fructose PTS system EIIBC or EIIC component
MTRIVAVTACPTGIAHTLMAAEALKKTSEVMGHDLRVETQGSEGIRSALTEREIQDADVVIIASDIKVDMDRFAVKPVYAVSTSEAIRRTRAVIEAALAEMEEVRNAAPSAPEPTLAQVSAGRKRLVAVTSCPTGIAHTFMAAEALRKAAAAMGHEIKVETQGSVGAQNVLTPEEIARADAVILAADAYVDKSRFVGKPLYETSTTQALNDGQGVVTAALALPKPEKSNLVETVKQVKAARSSGQTGPYRHLMTGVSYMLPVVVAGGLMIALAFAIGGINAADNKGSFAAALLQIGGGTAFTLFVPVLSAFMAFSIADRPGIAPGLIGGALATSLGAGFLGGIISGFLAGYVTKYFNDRIQLPRNLEGLKPVLILPFLGTLVVGLLMIYVIGTPVQAILKALTTWLAGMQEASAAVLGLILGAMMAFDMGGPVNKSAYTFSVGLLASSVNSPMAAVMAAGMTPPLALGLSTYLFRNRFTFEEREAGNAALVLGLSFITEGAIPFAARDPLRVIPSIMVGSAVTGAISMAAGCRLLVPHGGVFAMAIPGAVVNLPMYLVAIVVGTLVTSAALYLVKRPVVERVTEESSQEVVARQAAA